VKICPSCNSKGVLIIDNFNGEIISSIKDIVIEENKNGQTL
jgi:hypothetical protein